MKTANCTLLTLFVSLLIMTACVMAKPSNKWRLEFSGKAYSDGEIVIAIKPIGGEEFTVSIPVTGGTSENNVAKIVTSTLKEQLSEEAFYVERKGLI